MGKLPLALWSLAFARPCSVLTTDMLLPGRVSPMGENLAPLSPRLLAPTHGCRTVQVPYSAPPTPCPVLAFAFYTVLHGVSAYAMFITDSVSAYARAMPCPVLAQRTVHLAMLCLYGAGVWYNSFVLSVVWCYQLAPSLRTAPPYHPTQR
eukprot:3280451-Rhodomonas_salina.1